MAGKSVRTITEHILNQVRDWALGGGEVAASAFGALLLGADSGQAQGQALVTPDLQDSRLRLQHPKKF